MARQVKNNPQVGDAKKKGDEKIQTLSTEDVDPLPEKGMSPAAQNAAPREPIEKEPAKVLQQSREGERPLVEYFRVLADRMIMGAAGTRARLRAGKVVATNTYNIKRLVQQGVQLEKISADDARSSAMFY